MMQTCVCGYVGLADDGSSFDGLDGYRHTARVCWDIHNPLRLKPSNGRFFETPKAVAKCACPIKDLWSDTGHARNCPERKVTK